MNGKAGAVNRDYAPPAEAPPQRAAGGRFLRQVVTLAFGTAGSQALTLLAAPLLTRLYAPDAFGEFALFSTLVAVVGLIACWRYELAITLPAEDGDAANLLALSIALAAATSLAALAAVWLLRGPMAAALGAPSLEKWLWLAPLGVFLTGAFQAASYWSTRKKRFAVLATSKFGQSSAMLGVQIGAGAALRPAGPPGLIAGQLVGQAASLALIAARAFVGEGAPPARSVRPARAAAMARKYSELPRYALHTTLLNALAKQCLPIIVAAAYGAFSAGLVAFAQRLIAAPISVVVGAVWQVTHAEIGRLEFAEKRRLLMRVHALVSYGYAFPFAAAALFAHLMGPIFGEQWGGLTGILPALAASIYVNSVSNSSSYFAAFSFYRAEAAANIVLAVASLGAAVVASRTVGFETAVAVYAFASLAVYLGVIAFWSAALEAGGALFGNLLASAALSVTLLLPARLLAGESLPAAAAAVAASGAVYYALVYKKLGWGLREGLRLE